MHQSVGHHHDAQEASLPTLLYESETFLTHETGAHPERPERLRAIHRGLAERGLPLHCRTPEWNSVAAARLERIHDRGYIEQIERTCREGGGRLDADTVVSRGSFEAATLAAGAVCDAVDRVLRGEARNALCLVRPPGHHALADRAMGFCLFNNIAVAAAAAVADHELHRVLAIDWDVHHGNGTQDAFYREERVGFLSIHRYPFYPMSGTAEETGAGPGVGATLNIPLAGDTLRDVVLDRFRTGLDDMVRRIQPELILLSAGFDAHRADPVGSLGLETEDFATLTDLVRKAADAACGGRLVSVLEGGYNTGVLADCVAVHLERLLIDD